MPNIFDVNGFKAAIGNGGARPNQFEVLMYPNAAIGGPALVPATYMCTAASLPGTVLNAAIVHYRGREVKFAGDRVFSPWQATFLNDTNFSARGIVERWMNVMEERTIKVGATTPLFYYGMIEVWQLNRNGARMRGYQLTDCFPVDISDVGLAYNANDTISSFSVTWQYQQFFILPGVDAPENVVFATPA
jgi:hypothetical protein